MRHYVVRHVTRYTYEQEVTESYGRAYLTPRAEAGQQLLEHRIETTPQAALLSSERDAYGNVTSYTEVLTPHTTFEVRAVSEVDVDRPVPAVAEVTTPIQDVRQQLAEHTALHHADNGWESLWLTDFALATRFVPFDVATAQFAAPSLHGSAPIGPAVLDLMHRVHAELAYRPGTTSVSTTPVQALRQRAGVCQDYAHLMLACLRQNGLPARYVSGYLETLPPPGQPKRLGADASHAWVSVLLPQVGWVDLDPTNDQIVDEGYLTLAWGRDYGDVTPLRGVVYTEGPTLSLDVEVDVLRRD